MPVRILRIGAVILANIIGIGAAAIFLQYSAANGLTPFAVVSTFLLFLSTTWLAWGAMLGLIGLPPMPRAGRFSDAPIVGTTAVLVPVCNEDPTVTFARVAAMFRSVREATDATVHFAILSDTRTPAIAQAEELWFTRLLRETGGEGQIFYRRRTQNTGRKAGNIEDFFRRSGAAYDYSLILDADSLMEGKTIAEMIRRDGSRSKPRAASDAARYCAGAIGVWTRHAVCGSILLSGVFARSCAAPGQNRPVLGT
jgi:membrane glycosyltransferase